MKHTIETDYYLIISGANVIKASRMLIAETQAQMGISVTEEDIIRDEEGDDEESDRQEADMNWERAFTESMEQPDTTNHNVTPVRCAAHSIQLAVTDFLNFPEVKDVTEALKKACGKIRERIQSDRIMATMPQKPNSTRWSSFFTMLNGMIKIKDAIKDELSDELWTQATGMRDALQPIQELTTRLQKVQYCCGDLFKDMLIAESQLEKNGSHQSITLLVAFRSRKTMITENLQFQAALYFDPVINNVSSMHFSDATKGEVLRYLADVNEKIGRVRRRMNLSPSALQSTSSPPLRDQVSVVPVLQPTDADLSERDQLFLRIWKTIPPENDRPSSIRDRLLQLERQPQPCPSIDKVLYWRALAQRDTEMGELASVVLALPASQVSVERAFSALPLILTKLRTRTSNSNMKSLLDCRLNKDLLE